MSEAEKFSPALARRWGSTEECLGVKYDCFVLPAVLMPRGGFPHCFCTMRKSFSTMNMRLVEAGDFLPNLAGGLVY